jgi:RNA polymerase sigma-70 factor (ECF subfamily)
MAAGLKTAQGINQQLLEIHNRLLAGDPTATAEFAEVALGPLKRALHSIFRSIRDDALLNDAAVDAYMEYVKAPEKYDPQRSSLFSFLKLAAKRDALNALRRDKKFQHAQPLDDEPVELNVFSGNKPGRVQKHDQKESDIVTQIDSQARVRNIFTAVREPQDRAVLKLMMDGERNTSAFATALGISHLSKREREHRVKQCKDRLIKYIKRSEEKRGRA